MEKFRQEMPPLGGYAPIIYERVPLKSALSAKTKMLIFIGITGASFAHYVLVTKRKVNNERLEMRSSRLALHPMIHAENDRTILKQLKKNREEEEKIMKDVPGWEVGKWKGNRVYLTIGPDEYFKPHLSEYFAHVDKYVVRDIVLVKKLH